MRILATILISVAVSVAFTYWALCKHKNTCHKAPCRCKKSPLSPSNHQALAPKGEPTLIGEVLSEMGVEV